MSKGNITPPEDLEVVIEDVTYARKKNEVAQPCAVCGTTVYKTRLLPRARCFDCRKKANIKSAVKAYNLKKL